MLGEKSGNLVKRKQLFVGRNKENNSGLFLYDTNGKPKLKIYVVKEGETKREVMDKEGKARSIIDTKREVEE